MFGVDLLSKNEEAFFDEHKVILKDIKHSWIEERFILIVKTEAGRLLYIVYTMRKDNIRVISVRNGSQKEVILYEKAA